MSIGIHTLAFLGLGLVGCKTEESQANWYATNDEGDLLGLDPDTGTPTGGGVLGECNEVETKINGVSGDDVPDPTVGDSWMIRMFCDGALLTGANRLFFQPAGVAMVDDQSTNAEFVASGSSTMTMQAGSFVYTKDIVVRGSP